MKMRERKMRCWGVITIFMILAVFLMVNTGWSQTHDLRMEPAPNPTSTDPADWKSPDLKLGADFGESFPPDTVRRGVANSIYARFYINGTQDFDVPSYTGPGTGIKISFYWIAGGVDGSGIPIAPPDLGEPGWHHIDDLPVTYDEPGGEDLYMTWTWPTDFPSVTTKSVEWTPPTEGDYFYVAAEVVYPDGYDDQNDGDNKAISMYESILGVRDVDVALVVDASNSMNLFNFEGDDYIEHAKDKSGLFIFSMPGTGAHKAAVVAFSSQYVGYSEDIWPTPVASLEPVTNANKNDIVVAIGGISAGGNTPMGAGLQRAIDILTADAPDPNRKRAILLLSDGYESSYTPRACPDPGTCVDGDIVSQLQANNIRLFSVALGEYADVDCLECLAVNSSGQWYGSIDPGVDLAEVLLDMQQAYTADDLYRVDRGVSGGGDDTYSIYFEGKDNVLYFILAWDDLSTSLGLELRPPRSRAWINPELSRLASVQKGKGYLVARVKRPKKGTWGYRVTGPAEERYLVAVRSDRVGVRLTMDAVSAGKVGYPIEITAQLMAGKKPVKTNRLYATVQVPVVSLDTIMRKASRTHMLRYKTLPVDPKVLVKNPDLSYRAAFINKLKGKKHQPLVKTRSVKVPLKYVGKGLYKGVLGSKYTTAAGKYNVTVECNEKRFHRNFSRQLRLRPGKVEHEKSSAEILNVKSEGGKYDWLLCCYPTDKFGNAITASSLAKGINAGTEKGKLVQTPKAVFGAFQQKVYVLPGQKPRLLMVTINGKTIKKIGRTQ